MSERTYRNTIAALSVVALAAFAWGAWAELSASPRVTWQECCDLGRGIQLGYRDDGVVVWRKTDENSDTICLCAD